ncbi:MAG: 16S rRNA (guanine(966)-N(2))-methyltransferase RsmD [Anaerolineae bacterium]
MSVRVIAGSARGRRLKLVPGDSTRPIMDRVKEALFSILGTDVFNARVLDLFAGTGSVGIEALSRGAREAVFIEKNPLAIRTITENVRIAQVENRAVVRKMDVFTLLGMPPEHYDLIYIAPPQYKDLWSQTLKALDANPGWLSPESQVIVQIDPAEFTQIEWEHLTMVDERRYGKTLLVFFQLKGEGEGDD